jgi:flagellar biosynthesis/type III secretory pathway protein FliH
VHENVLAAIVTDDEAESLLRIEELYDALALADDLRRHSATAATAKAATAAAAAEAAAATAEAITAATAETVATATAEAVATAAVATATAAAAKAIAAAEAAAVTIAAFTTEEIVALVTAATTAVPLTPFIETHARLNSLCPQSLRTNALGPKSATGQVRHLLTHRSAPYSKNACVSSAWRFLGRWGLAAMGEKVC